MRRVKKVFYVSTLSILAVLALAEKVSAQGVSGAIQNSITDAAVRRAQEQAAAAAAQERAAAAAAQERAAAAAAQQNASTTTTSGGQTAGTSGGTILETNLTPATGTNTPAPNGQATGPGPTINQGADKARKQEKKGQMLNTALGVALIAAGMAPCPEACNIPLIIMGGLALAQAGADRGAAAGSGATFDSSLFTPDTGGLYTDDNPGGNDNPGGGTDFNQLDPATLEGLKKLESAGYKVTSLGVQTPDGSTLPFDTFNSTEAMTAAGFNGAQAASALGMAKKTGDELMQKYGPIDGAGPNVVSMGVNSGGGGAGGSSGGDYGGGDSGLDDYLASLRKRLMNPEEQKRMLAGKSLTMGSDPIGVRMDNIFEMVHRRYQTKRKVNTFIEQEVSNTPAKKPFSF